MNEKMLVPCRKCSRLNRLDLAATRNQAAPVCGACKTALPVHANVADASGEGLSRLIKAAAQPVVLDFWAPWCGPCKAFAPVFEEASKRLGERLHFIEVDTESDPASGARFQVRSIPTLVVLRNGVEALRQSGAMPLDMLLRWLEQVPR